MTEYLLPRNISIIVFFTCTMLSTSINSNSLPKYGEFILHVQRFDLCKGPKRLDCSVINASIIDDTIVNYDIVVTENMKPTKSKITATSNGKLLVRLQTDDPCEHLFLKPLLQSMMKVTDQCVILKGHYNFKLDIQDIAKTYYQGAFIYGNITFKSLFYNNHCNLSCTIVKVSFSPKDTQTNNTST